ncbi:CASTOR/POLLUX-related putative ion channel [Streptomyces atriruber]|uniref:CASTOR/POLLUX-related putative ion channel n=1 Tax=Streptomyces atriruber TaxID=545121 RepID=UPI0006E337E8|nr:hypothetical protein [Streptomyces atriruber]
MLRRFRYRFDNAMARGTPAMIGVIAAAMLALAFLNAITLLVLAPDLVRKEGGASVLWRSALRVLNPPGMLQRDYIPSDPPVGVAYRIVSTVITIIGILLLSTLIGVLGAGIQRKLAKLRKGRSVVVESDHTVILGWSEQVHMIISELVEANRNQKYACVTVLAPKDKAQMDDAIRERVGATAPTRVVCRTGDPTRISDINLVNPKEARSIVVLPPEHDDADISVIKSLLAVTSGALSKASHEGRAVPHVVTSIADDHNLPAALIAGGAHTHVVSAQCFIARLLVQTSLQSGLSIVYTGLLEFDGDEIYMSAQPQLAGRTFGEAVYAFRTSTVIGIRRLDGQILLNPPADSAILGTDQIVAISEDDDTVIPTDEVPTITFEAIVTDEASDPQPERVLLLGWNARTPEAVKQLAHLAPEGSRLDIVADVPDLDDRVERLRAGLPQIELGVLAADPANRVVLEEVDLAAYQHVMVVGDAGGVDKSATDSRTLMTLLHLRDLAVQHGHDFSVVTEMADDRNRTLAQAAHADDFILSDNLLSLRMAQTSENPELNRLFQELFDPEGCQIRLRPAQEYVQPHATVSFYTVVEAALRRDQIAIGYRLARHAQRRPDYGIVVNPDKAALLSLTGGDMVIVLDGRC